MFPHVPHPYVLQGWQEGAITFNPTYKYHLGCNIYSGDPLPPGVGAVKAVDSYASLTDSEATTEGKRLGLKHIFQQTGFGKATDHYKAGLACVHALVMVLLSHQAE
jgi:hypothetical protein